MGLPCGTASRSRERLLWDLEKRDGLWMFDAANKAAYPHMLSMLAGPTAKSRVKSVRNSDTPSPARCPETRQKEQPANQQHDPKLKLKGYLHPTVLCCNTLQRKA